MAKRKPKEKKMPREVYGKILQGMQLVDISLQSCSANLKSANLSLAKGLSAEVKDKASYETLDGSIAVIHTFNLLARQEGSKDYIFKISASYRLVYEYTEPVNDEFFDIFKGTSLVLNSWPYFRELAQSLTQRMGIPPLTLPLVKTA